MRQSPTNEKGAIMDVKVVDVEKRKTKDSGSAKNYVRKISRVVFLCLPAVYRLCFIVFS